MRPKPRFFLPNRLSIFRMLTGLAIPALIFIPGTWEIGDRPWSLWAAFGLFVVGAFTDFWDGWLARRHGLETAGGKILDPTADKIFILGCMASFAAKGVYSYWFLVPIALREIAVTFCRVVWLRRGQAVGAEQAGKLKLGLQVASVAVSFVYLAFPYPWLRNVNHLCLTLALVATLYSGFFFFRRNGALVKTPAFARAVGTLGAGNLQPFPPGTYGSLLGLAIVPFVSFDPFLHALMVICLCLVTYAMIPRMSLGEHEDPLEVVIDEVCGVLVAFWMVPLSWKTVIAGFLLFRLFDVTKVFPISWLEKRKGVHGILWDDIGAGIYTALVLRILF